MFIPETIDLGQSEKYILSIRIKPTGFLFSISEPKIGKNYCLRQTSFSRESSLLENIKRIIFDSNFLTQQFLETNVILVSTNYDIIPLHYYRESEKNNLHDFVCTDKDKYAVSCENESYNNVTIFDIDREIYDFLSRSLYKPRFYHHTNLLMRFFDEKNKIMSLTSKVFLNFHDDMMDVICFSKAKFAHCLSYETESPENQIYYILQLWDKCNLNQQTDHLMIFGQPDGSVVPILQEYIKNISSIHTPSEVYLWSEDALKAPLDLLTLSL